MNLVSIANRFLKIPRRLKPSDLRNEVEREAIFNGSREAYFYLGPNFGLTRLADGHHLYVDPMDESIAVHLITRGYWEIWVHDVVKRLVRPGDNVIEVGANFGYYTMSMAQGVGRLGSVTAIEANPKLADLIRRSTNFNGYNSRVTVIDAAAAAESGRTQFTVSRRNAGGGHLKIDGGAFDADRYVVEVEAIRLDDLDIKNVRLIRMDAEGSEPLVLAGATKLLARDDIVVCMEWDTVQMRSRVDVEAFARDLFSQGFRFWEILYTGEIRSLDLNRLIQIQHCDLVMSRAYPI